MTKGVNNKTIVATALYDAATVITKDEEIKESGLCKTIRRG